MLLSVVMPVFNEAKTLRDVVKAVCALPLEKQIVLVDDCSTDGSAEIVDSFTDSAGCSFVKIHQDVNRGKGAALQKGFSVADGDVVIVQDADLEYFPEKDYIPMLKAYEDNKADFVYGSRTL